MNNLYSSPKKVYMHYITLLFYFNWIWRRSWNLQSFGPWGPSPWAPMVATCTIWTPLNPGPWGWFLPSLVKIQPCISSRSRWTVTLYIGPPPQPVTPHGAIGATSNLYSSPKKVSTLYTTWMFYLNWIWRRKFEIFKVLALGGPPPGPPWWQHVPYDHLWIPSP